MLNTFIARAETLVRNSSSFEQAMRRARFLGELCWKNSMGCYQLMQLETDLLDRYAALFSEAAQALQQNKETAAIPYLHVLTKAYDTGGHTRVVERFISSQALKDSAVLVTEKVQVNTQQRLAQAKLGLHCLPTDISPQEKIQQLLRHFANAKTIVLHIHPNDIETAFAAALAKRLFGTQILFYNHADHVFSYGYACADKTLELSYFGWTLTQERGVDQKAHFVGIPLKLPKLIATSDIKQTSEKSPSQYLATSGSAYKFKPSQGYSFPEVAKQLTKATGLDMVLVGPNPKRDWWWWLPRLQFGKQLRFTGKLQHQAYLDCISQASAYIDSFPMTGGTSFSEILCQGVPCFGILTGAHGYSPADQLKSADASSLVKDVVNYLHSPNLVQERIKQIQPEVVHAHDLETVAERIVSATHPNSPLQTPPWDNPIPVNTRFYEKIWQSQFFFSVPVHSLPDLGILMHFLRFWIAQKLAR